MSSNINNNSNNSQSNQNNQNNQNNQILNNAQKYLEYAYYFEVICYLYFFVSTLLFDNPYTPALYGFFLRIIRTTWPIKFDKEYLASLLKIESFSFFLYVLLLNLFAKGKVYLLLFPSLISALIYLLGFHRRKKELFPLNITVWIDKIRNYQDYMLNLRSSYDILLLPFTVIGVFFNFNSFIMPVAYYQLLKLKVKTNESVRGSLIHYKELFVLYSNNNNIIGTISHYLIKACDMLNSN